MDKKNVIKHQNGSYEEHYVTERGELVLVLGYSKSGSLRNRKTYYENNICKRKQTYFDDSDVVYSDENFDEKGDPILSIWREDDDTIESVWVKGDNLFHFTDKSQMFFE